MMLTAQIILDQLSPVHRRLAYLLISGSSTSAEMARLVKTSSQVVKNYLGYIFEVLGATNRVNAALIIVRCCGLESALRKEFEHEHTVESDCR